MLSSNLLQMLLTRIINSGYSILEQAIWAYMKTNTFYNYSNQSRLKQPASFLSAPHGVQ